MRGAAAIKGLGVALAEGHHAVDGVGGGGDSVRVRVAVDGPAHTGAARNGEVAVEQRGARLRQGALLNGPSLTREALGGRLLARAVSGESGAQ